MVRVGISVEGETEKKFVEMVLSPYLLGKEVYLEAKNITGNVSVDRVKVELRNLSYSFDYVTTLYDFYGFKNKKNYTKKMLEQKIHDKFDDSTRWKIIPYIQMHEFEGLLFSSPQSIAKILKNDKLKEWAESILNKFNSDPEKINDSKQTAPSKRLEEKTNYIKTLDGPSIANDIGIEAIRKKCAGFNAWISTLEKLNDETSF